MVSNLHEGEGGKGGWANFVVLLGSFSDMRPGGHHMAESDRGQHAWHPWSEIYRLVSGHIGRRWGVGHHIVSRRQQELWWVG